MSNPFTVYDTATGKVLRSGSAPGDPEDQAGEGESVFPERVSPAKWFVNLNTGQLQEKTELNLSAAPSEIIADGQDTATIAGVPAGAHVLWHDGLLEEVLDGQVQLATDLAGTYRLRFFAIPYLDQEVTIEAVPAT